ncbi:hypothetical protein [Mesorhizobium sp.]|nr:hypothetical protein [Mesorhizobium sp.]TIS63867.1 MAG: hypothetical protein E5W92_25785 [Mesorhizobium sp.]
MLEMNVREVQQLFPPIERLQIGPTHRSARVLSSWGAGFIVRTEHQAHAFRRHEGNSSAKWPLLQITVVLVPHASPSHCLSFNGDCCRFPGTMEPTGRNLQALFSRRYAPIGVMCSHRRQTTGIAGCERPPRFRPKWEQRHMVSLKTAKSGIAFPSDLTLLKQVFDRVRVEEGIPVGSEQAERLSVIAMELFSDGEFDEAVLYERLRLYARL